MSQAPALTLDLRRSDDGDPGIAPPSADRPLTAAEQQQVDQAVATVNAILLRKNLEIAIELRRYVLAEFFGGSWQAWADNRPGASPAYDAFAIHRRLRVGKDTLRELIRVGEQVRQLPAPVAAELSVAHHRALLPLKDDTERTQLAKKAVQEGLTAAQLGDEVRQLHPPAVRRTGRPSQPRGYKKLGHAFKAGRDVDPKRVVEEAAGYTAHQKSVVVERARALKALAEAVLAGLQVA